VGGTFAWGGVALTVSSAAYYVATTDDEAFPLAATIPLTALSILAGLVLLGVAVRQADALPGRWRSLPLAMGAGAVPLVMIGGILEKLNERLLEIPIVALGLAWMALGYALWSQAPDLPEQAPMRA
jgi:peptidoglycan/LPS O-acetylase OafA/YrhL